eukprot:588780-Amphidinium_carterae.1
MVAILVPWCSSECLPGQTLRLQLVSFLIVCSDMQTWGWTTTCRRDMMTCLELATRSHDWRGDNVTCHLPIPLN